MNYLLTTYRWPLLSRPLVAGFKCPVTSTITCLAGADCPVIIPIAAEKSVPHDAESPCVERSSAPRRPISTANRDSSRFFAAHSKSARAEHMAAAFRGQSELITVLPIYPVRRRLRGAAPKVGTKDNPLCCVAFVRLQECSHDDACETPYLRSGRQKPQEAEASPKFSGQKGYDAGVS